MTAADHEAALRDALTGSHAGRTAQGLAALDALVGLLQQAEQRAEKAVTGLRFLGWAFVLFLVVTMAHIVVVNW